MSKRRVINFEPKERLLEKAGAYIESVELFLEEKDEAIRHFASIQLSATLPFSFVTFVVLVVRTNITCLASVFLS